MERRNVERWAFRVEGWGPRPAGSRPAPRRWGPAGGRAWRGGPGLRCRQACVGACRLSGPSRWGSSRGRRRARAAQGRMHRRVDAQKGAGARAHRAPKPRHCAGELLAQMLQILAEMLQSPGFTVPSRQNCRSSGRRHGNRTSHAGTCGTATERIQKSPEGTANVNSGRPRWPPIQ